MWCGGWGFGSPTGHEALERCGTSSHDRTLVQQPASLFSFLKPLRGADRTLVLLSVLTSQERELRLLPHIRIAHTKRQLGPVPRSAVCLPLPPTFLYRLQNLE